jgi:hypothetical protein
MLRKESTMIIKRLGPEWYRLDAQSSPYYVGIQKVDDLFWQGSIRDKGSNTEVSHTGTFRRLSDAR